MAYINGNNFIQWEAFVSQLENQEFDGSLDSWTNVDHPELGAGGDAFVYDSNWGAAAAGLPDFSQGLQQSVTIEKDGIYQIEMDSRNCAGVPSNVVEVWFMDDSGNSQKTVMGTTAGSTRDTFTKTVVADADYTKIIFAAYTSPTGNVCFTCSFFRFKKISNECFYALPLYKNDEIKHLCNYVFDEYEEPFGLSKLGLYDVANNQIYLRDIATLNYIELGGDNYTFYFEYTIPPSMIYDEIRFVIYKDWTGSDEIIYLSNLFQFISNTENTSLIKYTNSKNALDYYYESLASFYNQFRVDMHKGRPQFRQQTIGYETYEGKTINTRTNIQKPVMFETRFLDEAAHEAMFAVFQHSEFYIDGVRYEKPNGSEYEITWSEFDDNKIGNGSIELNLYSYSKAIKNC